ncbi:MAG TPA: hypothetical protein VLD13_10715 [Gaiellaceae bacterium]|nr:hypothetical protein [Gaiellaceae bacterium]
MLTALQEALAEAHGLAISAASTLDRVEERVLDGRLRRDLGAMRLDANELRARCLEVERWLGEELAAEILARANTVAEQASDLALAWFKAGTGPLSAWGFLAMGEAGEVAAWAALEALSRGEGPESVAELAAWALPVQRRHLQLALDGCALLAEAIDPASPRWG